MSCIDLSWGAVFVLISAGWIFGLMSAHLVRKSDEDSPA